jgi:dihydrofolate reductase
MSETNLPEAAVFIATSLDGYIAREDGSLDWLLSRAGDGDYGYAEFIATIDVIVMGRKSFEAVLDSDPWLYEGTRVVVLSTGSPEVPEALRSSVEVLSLEPGPLLRHLAASGVRRVYVDGGQTIQGFLRAGLIQEITITRVPVLIGSGIPLFGDLPKDVPLDHVGTETFPNGMVQSRYHAASAA